MWLAVEVEVVGIPADCYKYKTKMSQRNSLNPIWEDTFELEVRGIVDKWKELQDALNHLKQQ